MMSRVYVFFNAGCGWIISTFKIRHVSAVGESGKRIAA